jgi:hypothetical protein
MFPATDYNFFRVSRNIVNMGVSTRFPVRFLRLEMFGRHFYFLLPPRLRVRFDPFLVLCRLRPLPRIFDSSPYAVAGVSISGS